MACVLFIFGTSSDVHIANEQFPPAKMFVIFGSSAGSGTVTEAKSYLFNEIISCTHIFSFTYYRFVVTSWQLNRQRHRRMTLLSVSQLTYFSTPEGVDPLGVC